MISIVAKIFRRFFKCRKINKSSRDRQVRAENRDNYYVRKLIPEVKVVEEEKLKIIKDFWKPYEFAYKNNPMTQVAFYNQSGNFDPSYVGFGQQVHSLVRFWNNETFSTFRNKNYSRLLFPFLKHVKCYVSCSYGNYFDEDYNVLSRDRAIDKICEVLNQEKELILKPTLDSGSGSSIVFLTENENRASIISKISKLEPHFVCQEILKNHESFKTGCNALNTIRVCTLNYNNKINYVGALFRMSTGKRVDNWDAGGIVCAVNKDGTLGEFAISGNGTRYNEHPTGFKFRGHKLYRGSEILDTAIKCHQHIPQQKYISWDFTVDEQGEIVFIEMNSPGGSEVAQCLGINSYINKDIAKEIFDEYIYLYKANFDWDYRENAHYVLLMKYQGVKNVVKVPDEIEGKPVKMVLMGAFDDTNVKKIILPENVQMNTSKLTEKKIIIERK